MMIIREFASHSDALKGQDTDRAEGRYVGGWFAYQGTTSYVVDVVPEERDVKLEGQS